MTKRRTLSALFAAGALVVAGATAVRAEPPNQADLQKQIDQLQQQVKELQEQRAATPAFSAKDVDAAVDSVLRDADRRSQLLAESGGFYGGYMDDKFQIRSADGNFSISPTVFFQFRSTTNLNEDAKNGGSDDNIDNGFEMRRLKFGFDGNAWSKRLYYNFVWATDRKTGNVFNEEAYIRYQFSDNFAVKAGQYKELVNQESSVSSKRKLGTDVSFVNQFIFGGDTYIQGVELNYDDNNAIQASLGFTDGFNSFNTNFQDPPTNSFDFGVTGRVQYKVFGDWKSYSDQTALGNKQDLLVIGAGADWSQNGDTNIIRHDVDVQWETGPFALFGAFYGRYTDTAGGGNSFDWGAIVQGAYLVNDQLEVFGRYGYLKVDNVSSPAEDTFCDFVIGANYYFHKHNLKVTVEGEWLPSGSPTNLDAIGVLANDGKNEFIFRAQLQFFL
jgi:hypothetical protein